MPRAPHASATTPARVAPPPERAQDTAVRPVASARLPDPIPPPRGGRVLAAAPVRGARQLVSQIEEGRA
jgi:hypothetical protein